MTLSGFVSVYLESLFKNLDGAKTLDIWDRNFQLAFWCAAAHPALDYGRRSQILPAPTPRPVAST